MIRGDKGWAFFFICHALKMVAHVKMFNAPRTLVKDLTSNITFYLIPISAYHIGNCSENVEEGLDHLEHCLGYLDCCNNCMWVGLWKMVCHSL